MKNVTVLGAAGFIGSHLSAYLASQPDITLTVYDKFPVELKGFKNVRSFVGTLTDNKLLSAALKNQDVVYYLASASNPSSSWNDPVIEVRENLQPFLKFIEICAKKEVKRIAFISSGGTVYGKATGIISEDTPVAPFSPYGVFKVCIENLLLYANERYGIPADIYRLSNAYGPGQKIKPGFGVVATWLSTIISESSISIFGDGDYVRDFIFIDDIVKLISLSIENREQSTTIYNVSSGTALTLNQLTGLFKKVIPHEFTVKYFPSRPSDNPYVVLNNKKIMNEFPGFSFHSIDSGIEATYKSLELQGTIKQLL